MQSRSEGMCKMFDKVPNNINLQGLQAWIKFQEDLDPVLSKFKPTCLMETMWNELYNDLA